MTPLPHYSITFDPQVRQHLRFIGRNHHSEIQHEIEDKLSFEPDVPTRNRKPMNVADIANSEWELRCGSSNQIRVFYSVYPDDLVVYIVAIGEKRGSRLFIEGKEVEL